MEYFQAEKSKIKVLGSLFIGLYSLVALLIVVSFAALVYNFAFMDSSFKYFNSAIQEQPVSQSHSSHHTTQTSQLTQPPLSMSDGLHSLLHSGNIMTPVILVILSLYLCMNIIGIIVGIRLLRMARGSRSHGLALSVVSILLYGPIGVCVGVVGLIILLDKRTIAYFEAYR